MTAMMRQARHHPKPCIKQEKASLLLFSAPGWLPSPYHQGGLAVILVMALVLRIELIPCAPQVLGEVA